MPVFPSDVSDIFLKLGKTTCRCQSGTVELFKLLIINVANNHPLDELSHNLGLIGPESPGVRKYETKKKQNLRLIYSFYLCNFRIIILFSDKISWPIVGYTIQDAGHRERVGEPHHLIQGSNSGICHREIVL